MADEFHVNDVGTVIIVALKEGLLDVDPTGNTKVRFFIQRKAKDNILEVAPTVYLDPLDNKNKLKYVTLAGDFNIAGKYLLQVYIEFADGKWHTSTYEFEVSANIRDIPST